MRAWASVVRLAGAADQEQGTDTALGGDGTAGQDAQAGSCCKGGDGDQPYIGRAGCQAICALRGQHAVDLVAKGKRGVERRMFEVPHEGRGIEEADGCDAQTGLGQGSHALIDYFSEAVVLSGASAATTPQP